MASLFSTKSSWMSSLVQHRRFKVYVEDCGGILGKLNIKFSKITKDVIRTSHAINSNV